MNKPYTAIWVTITIGFIVLGAKIKATNDLANTAYDRASDAYYDADVANARVEGACYILNNGC